MKRLIQRFDELKIDALLVSHLPNIRYLTGFTGSSALLLVTSRAAVFITDPRYTIQARQETGFDPRIVKGKSLWTAIPGILKRRKLRRVGFETHRTTHAQFQAVRDAARLKPVKDVVETLRMVKTADEIDRIRKSVHINSKAFERALKHFRIGMKEQDLAAQLNHFHLTLGAEGHSFETIVASGARSALPHARPTNAPILKDEVLLIDMGALFRGYASDMTRVAFTGRPSTKVKDLYQAVLEAQQAAIDAVRPGVPAWKVDQAARESLKVRKLDELFTHSTGHGLGLEIHESPSIRKNDKTKLQAGMTITIEPGVYMEGVGGIRIEDTVLVTQTGCEVLTPTPKRLIEL